MDKIEIRPIHNDGELGQLYELWGKVFPEDKSFFQERLEIEDDYNYKSTWIANVNGEIAAAVQIFPYYINYEGVILKVGGIGNVATLPEFRGRGLTHTILKRQIKWMEDNDFDLSLLFAGINPFYEKLGWHTIPTHYKVLRKIPEIPENQYTISPCVESDFEEIKALYDKFSKNFVGTRIRSSSYFEAQIKRTSNLLMAKNHDKISAYLSYRLYGNKIIINECCYLEGHENAVLSLLNKINHYDGIRIDLPSNHILSGYFQNWGAEEVAETSGMWKVINYHGLMNKLRPVFIKRTESEAVNYTILLQCGESDEVLFTKKEGIVEMIKPTDSFAYNELIKLNESTFITMLLEGSKENKLFPKVNYLFCGTDSF